MAGPKFVSNRTSHHALSHSDYTWEYEYYEFEPVSFEGLKAHKCKSYWEFSVLVICNVKTLPHILVYKSASWIKAWFNHDI